MDIFRFSCSFLTTKHKITNIFFTISFYFSWSNPSKKLSLSLSLSLHGQSSHQLKLPHLSHSPPPPPPFILPNPLSTFTRSPFIFLSFLQGRRCNVGSDRGRWLLPADQCGNSHLQPQLYGGGSYRREIDPISF